MPKVDFEILFSNILDVISVDKQYSYHDIKLLLNSYCQVADIAHAVNANKTRFLFEEEKHKYGTRKLITRKF